MDMVARYENPYVNAIVWCVHASGEIVASGTGLTRCGYVLNGIQDDFIEPGRKRD